MTTPACGSCGMSHPYDYCCSGSSDCPAMSHQHGCPADTDTHGQAQDYHDWLRDQGYRITPEQSRFLDQFLHPRKQQTSPHLHHIHTGKIPPRSIGVRIRESFENLLDRLTYIGAVSPAVCREPGHSGCAITSEGMVMHHPARSQRLGINTIGGYRHKGKPAHLPGCTDSSHYPGFSPCTLNLRGTYWMRTSRIPEQSAHSTEDVPSPPKGFMFTGSPKGPGTTHEHYSSLYALAQRLVYVRGAQSLRDGYTALSTSLQPLVTRLGHIRSTLSTPGISPAWREHPQNVHACASLWLKLPPKARWFVVGVLNHSRRTCWSSLVDAALAEREQDLCDTRTPLDASTKTSRCATQCRVMGGQQHGDHVGRHDCSCYCGKFQFLAEQGWDEEHR